MNCGDPKLSQKSKTQVKSPKSVKFLQSTLWTFSFIVQINNTIWATVDIWYQIRTLQSGLKKGQNKNCCSRNEGTIPAHDWDSRRI